MNVHPDDVSNFYARNKRNCDIAAMIARISYISLYISQNVYTPTARSWLPTSVHVNNEGKTEHSNVIFIHYFVDMLL